VITITIDNSYSKITGVTSQEMSELKAILSYDADPSAAFYSGAGRSNKRYLIGKAGDFPTGLLPYVQEWVGSRIFTEIDTRRTPPVSVGFKLSLPFTPYQEQYDAADACIDAHRGIVSAVTAFGKSVTMALLIKKLGVKTLVVVPNLGLKEQLKATFKQLFGSLNNITVENIDSPALDKPGDHGALIIDECHHAAAKTYRVLNKKVWNNIYFRFFFTATAFRSRDEEQLLFESVAGRVIYRIDYHQAVEKGFIAPVEAYYIDLPKVETDAYTWPQVYSELIVHNKQRNTIIANFIESLHRCNSSTLCLVKEIKHGNNILETLVSDHKFGVPFIQGSNEYNEALLAAFNERSKPVLIGTTGVLGEGVDTKPAEYIVIAGLGKSKNQFMQQVGRGLRKYPGKESCKIILFRDPSHKYTLRHFNAQKKILLDVYGIKPVRLKHDAG
jgi:superfamily II DNA or RNA helicase